MGLIYILSQPHPTFHSERIIPEALGIPFEILGASEKNVQYQDFIKLNQGARLRHLFESVEAMLESDKSSSCVLHPHGVCKAKGRDAAISLGVTGSPCNPFSTVRTKRYQDGSVAGHSMVQTTMGSVIDFYRIYEPHAGITEQVEGFGKRMSHSDSRTPMALFLAYNYII